MSVFSLLPMHPSSAFIKGVTLAAICATLTGCALKPAFQAEDEEKTSAAKAQQARQAMRPSSVCSPLQGNPFAMRKKVLVLALPVQKPLEAAMKQAWIEQTAI